MIEVLEILLMIAIFLASSIYFIFSFLYLYFDSKLDNEKYKDMWWYQFGGIVSTIPVFIIALPIAITALPVLGLEKLYKKIKGDD